LSRRNEWKEGGFPRKKQPQAPTQRGRKEKNERGKLKVERGKLKIES